MDEDPTRMTIDWGADDDAEPVRAPEPAPALPSPPVPYRPSWDTEDEPAAAPPSVAVKAPVEVEGEEFDQPGAQKLGIVGGKGVGKSYLFQAIVYRTLAGPHAGALTHYIDGENVRILKASGYLSATGKATSENPIDFVKRYQWWERLDQTVLTNQQWYRLRLSFRTGWLGGQRQAMDVEFLDGSGEGIFEIGRLDDETRKIWEKAYLPARIMVFCFPLWAAFPGPDFTDEDWEKRELILAGFHQVLKHYHDVRDRNHETRSVRTILALTMGDDRRSALRALYDRWIAPYLVSPISHLKQLRTGSGVARYLNNARKVSEALHEEFASVRDHRIAGMPQNLNFGKGDPWIIPLSAIDGDRLDDINNTYKKLDDRGRRREAQRVAPIPIHVELPLLVALCERHNALM